MGPVSERQLAPPAQVRLPRVRLRLLGLAVALVLTLAAVTLLALDAHDLAAALDDLGALELPVLVGVGTALVVALVPASLVLAACGYLLGTLGGFPVGLLICTLAAAIAAAIARRVGGGEAAPQALGRRAARASAWMDERPVRSVVVARLLPGTPFTAVSYMLGLSRISLGVIALGSLVGFAPRALVYTALGGSIGHLDRPEAQIALAASVLLLLASLVVARARRASSQPVNEREFVDHG